MLHKIFEHLECCSPYDAMSTQNTQNSYKYFITKTNISMKLKSENISLCNPGIGKTTTA